MLSCNNLSRRAVSRNSRNRNLSPRLPRSWVIVPLAAARKVGDKMSTSGLVDGSYVVSDADKELFQKNGFVLFHGVMTEEEMKEHVDEVYYKFLRNQVPVPGLDLCDMSGAHGRKPEDFTIYNVMLPRIYYPSWAGNLLEQRCLTIAKSLLGEDMHLDFDQILAKKPESKDSVMAWHQDQAYWPPLQSDTTCANCWIAVSDVPIESGCMRYVPGTHLEKELRRHIPVGKTREESHAIYTVVDEAKDNIVNVPMKRGDVLVHRERVVHGSGANLSTNWRCGYVLNYKRRACIDEERRAGFTNSHNDEVQWDKFIKPPPTS